MASVSLLMPWLPVASHEEHADYNEESLVYSYGSNKAGPDKAGDSIGVASLGLSFSSQSHSVTKIMPQLAKINHTFIL